jgi:acyl-CoA thioesterase
MEIEQIGIGDCVVSMPVTHRHINIRGVVHGGALVSLADLSMLMLPGASLGKHTVTLDLNISFVRRAGKDGGRLLPPGVHKGQTTRVVRSSILDEEVGKLLAEARGTFFSPAYYLPDRGGREKRD